MKSRLFVFVGVVALVLCGATLWAMFSNPPRDEPPAADARPVPVRVWHAQREPVAIVDTYAGMIEPLRRYNLGFEVAGRLGRFGTNGEGRPLDEGDDVEAGDTLAVLDDAKLRARLDEAQAELEQAQDRMSRNRALRERNAVSEEEYRDTLTQLALRKSQVTLAEQALRDSVLLSPVGGVLARRMVNDGESISPHQTVFELLEVDQVVLGLGVPESRVLRLKEGMPVKVELVGDTLRGGGSAALDGRIRRIGASADQSSGMFRVEVLLDNDGRRLRPGLVARAHIVLDEIEAYRFRSDAAVIDRGALFLYSVDEENRAQRHQIRGAVEQEGDLIVRELPPDAGRIVVRGQRRLAPGVRVEVVEEGQVASSPAAEPGLRTSVSP